MTNNFRSGSVTSFSKIIDKSGSLAEGVIDKRAGSLCITRTGEGMI